MKSINSKLDKIYEYLKKNKDYSYNSVIIKYLKNKNNLTFDDDVLADVLTYTIDNNLEPINSINDAESLYNIIVFDKNDSEQYSLFFKILPLYRNYKNIIDINDFQTLYFIFQDKKMILGLYSTIAKYNNEIFKNVQALKTWYEYILEARRYYIDEQAFYSSIIDTLKTLPKVDIDYYIDKKLEEDKQMSGIYNINEDSIKTLEHTIECLKDESTEIEEKLKEAEILANSFTNNIEEKMKYANAQNKILLNELRDYAFEFEQSIRGLKKDLPINNNHEMQSTNTKLDTLIEKLQQYTNNNISNSNINNNNCIETNQCDEIMDFYLKQEIAIIKYNIVKKDYKIKKDVTEIDECVINKIKEIFLQTKKFTLERENEQVLTAYYWALYNDNIKIYNRVITTIDFNNYKFELFLFNKNITDKFEEDVYISLFPDRIPLISKFYKEDKIDLLVQLLNKNLEFDLEYDIFHYHFKGLIKALEIFGVETIAKCDPILFQNIKELNLEQYEYYKQIYDINPQFEVFKNHLIYPNEIYSTEELSKLNLKSQENLYDLFNNGLYYTRKIDAIEFTAYKDEIKKFISILSNDENKINYISPKLLDLENIMLFEQYVSLEYAAQKEIVTIISKEISPIAKMKVKKIVKNMQRKKYL